MTQEAPELAGSGQAGCVTCRESRAVMMVFPCHHTALCRLCFVKMIKHVMIYFSHLTTMARARLSASILLSAQPHYLPEIHQHPVFILGYKAESHRCVFLAVAGWVLDRRENKLRGCRLYLSWTCSP